MIQTTDTNTAEYHMDPRHPLYLGDWKRSIPYVDDYFTQDTYDEPHIKRKNTILSHHPEIKNLYGVDKSTIWITILAALSQVTLSHLFGTYLYDQNILMILSAWIIGGYFTNLYGVIIHEATHCLCHENAFINRLVGLTANIGIPFPIAMSFRRYHLEHHTYQGVIGKDPDLPLDWELTLIKGNPLLKIIWVFCYPLMYVIRGAAQQKKPTKWEIINWIFTISSNTLICYFNGWKGLLYIFLSLWLGYGFHPGAVHFIQEHYTFNDGQETYSYYGSGNLFFLNIGYHNEHHDFIRVPWSKLPAIKQLAPEFYDTLAFHTSWLWVLYTFISDTIFGPQSRVSRDLQVHRQARRSLKDYLHVPKKNQ